MGGNILISMMNVRNTIEENLLYTSRGLRTLWRLLVEEVGECIEVHIPPWIHNKTESGRLQIEKKACELESEGVNAPKHIPLFIG